MDLASGNWVLGSPSEGTRPPAPWLLINEWVLSSLVAAKEGRADSFFAMSWCLCVLSEAGVSLSAARTARVEGEAEAGAAAGHVGSVVEGEGPAVGLGDLAAEGESDAGARRFGGEEGDEEVGGIGDAGAAIQQEDLGVRVGLLPQELDCGSVRGRDSGRFEDGVGGVALEVDEELFELIGVGVDGEERAGFEVDRDAGFDGGDPFEERGEEDGLKTWRGKAGKACIPVHEARKSVGTCCDDAEGADGILLPVVGGRVSGEEVAEAGGEALDRGEGVVELVSDDAHESLPGEPFLFAEGAAEIGKHDEGMGTPALTKGGSADPETAHRTGKGHGQGAGIITIEAGGEAEISGGAVEKLFGRPTEEGFAGSVGKAETLAVVEGEDGDVEFGHDGAEECAGVHGPEALFVEGFAEGIDLDQDLAEGVIASGIPAADGKVPLADSVEDVGEGVEREEDAAEEGGPDECGGGEQHDGDGPPGRGLVGAGPEQVQRSGGAGKGGQESKKPQALFEPEAFSHGTG
jgi:hypothetical protein